MKLIRRLLLLIITVILIAGGILAYKFIIQKHPEQTGETLETGTEAEQEDIITVPQKQIQIYKIKVNSMLEAQMKILNDED